MSDKPESVKAGRARHFDLEPRKLRRLRLARGLTITGLAAELNRDKGYVSHIEKGDYGPSVAVATQIAEVLGCSLADLMPDDNGRAAL